MSMNLGWKHSIFGKTPSAFQLAKQELKMLELRTLHYDNQLLEIQHHVAYLKDRKKQLQDALSSGKYADPKQKELTYQEIEFPDAGALSKP